MEGFVLSGFQVDWTLLSTVFTATLLIYGIHRIVGIKKLEETSSQGRFQVIARYKHHLQAYIGVSLMALLYLASKLSWGTITLFIPVGLISLLYTLPLFGSKRLRDLHLIKIFLIAIVWAYLGVLPFLTNGDISTLVGLIFLEKFFFLLAITLPFDIRDLGIDGSLITLPKILGIKMSYILSIVALVLSFSLFLGYGVLGLGNFPMSRLTVILMISAYLVTYIFIRLSKNKTSDYYFSGLIDSTLIIRGLAFASILI